MVLSILFLAVAPQAWAEQEHIPGPLKTYETDIACGDIKAKIISQCSVDDTFEVTCPHQQLSLPSAAIDVTWDQATPHWKLSGWGCVTKEKKPYLLFVYANGGNCNACEQFQLRNLKGAMVKQFSSYRQTINKLQITQDAFEKNMHPVQIGLD